MLFDVGGDDEGVWFADRCSEFLFVSVGETFVSGFPFSTNPLFCISFESLERGIGGELDTEFGWLVGEVAELGDNPAAFGAIIKLDKAVALPCVSDALISVTFSGVPGLELISTSLGGDFSRFDCGRDRGRESSLSV